MNQQEVNRRSGLLKQIITKVLLGLVLAFVLISASWIGRFGANLFDYATIDPDGSFMWISVHHIFQALVFIMVMLIISKVLKINFHLGLGNKKEGIKFLKIFMLFFLLYTAGAFISIIFSGGFQAFGYPLNARNILGYLGFQLLLSGPSEELIFRAFAITMFAHFISKGRLHKHVSYANIFAAIVFGLAHIYIAINPFVISYSLFQVIYAAVLGYFYGLCYEKSQSVIYPMIMHSFTNVVMIGLTVILSFIL